MKRITFYVKNVLDTGHTYKGWVTSKKGRFELTVKSWLTSGNVVKYDGKLYNNYRSLYEKM